MNCPLHVLLVEDVEDVELLLAEQLSQEGFDPRIQRVEDAESFTCHLEQHDWHLVIADYQLPKFSAPAALQLLQSSGRDLPFIVISGSVDENTIVEVMRAGAHDYLFKGNLTRLAPAVRRELAEAAQRAARRQSEAALRRAESLGTAILDSLPVAVAVLGPDGRTLKANKLWSHSLAGHSPDPVLAAISHQCRPESHTACAAEALASLEAVLKGSLDQFDFDYNISFGATVQWFHLSILPLDQSEGAIVTRIDVSAQRRAEQESYLLARALRCSNDCISVTDLDDRILFLNHTFLETYGYESEELLHQSFDRVRSPRTPADALHRIRNATLQDGFKGEMIGRRRDGSEFPLAFSSAVIRDTNGDAVAIVTVSNDISDRRQAEEALRESEERFRSVVESLAEGLLITDLHDVVLYANSRMFHLTGYCPEELVGHTAYELLLRPDQWSEALQRDRRRSCNIAERYETELLRKDGKSIWTEVSAAPLRNPRGEIIGTVGAITDVTTRKQLEEQVRLSQKMDAVGQLAGGIAHDFNNILTVIQGYAELIKGNPCLDIETRAQIVHIGHSAERAACLTRQLLAFSRKQVIQLRKLNLNDLLDTLATMLQRLLGEQIQLRLNLSGDPAILLADRGMMEQILVNLTVNARDAMPRGGTFELATRIEEVSDDTAASVPGATAGRFICLDISDNGCGMSPEVLSHIFEPFFTTKEVGRGTGLGLSTVYGIVKQHSGWIQVHSELNAGTRFRIYFPHAPLVPAAETDNEKSPEAATISGGNETILLVEDEPALRALAKRALERLGYKVIEAASAPEAISVWQDRQGKIQLLLTDMVMPGGMTGRDLARTLRLSDPGLKVLLMSGYSVDLEREQPDDSEPTPFISKPYGPTTLACAVRAALDQHPAILSERRS